MSLQMLLRGSRGAIMRIGLVVDSACDLPKSFIEQNQIEILPISVRIDGQMFVDDRDRSRTADFYKAHSGDKGHDAETLPFTVDEIKDLFLSRLVVDFDYVLVQTIMQSRSPIFDNATKASFAILNGYKEVRKKADVEGPFALRVMDTQQIFCGQGVIAAETMRLINEGMPVNQIRQEINDLAPCVYSYATFPDIYYVRERARKKGDHSISWLGATLGTALNIKPIIRGYQGNTEPVAKLRGFEHAVESLFAQAVSQIKRGLLAPYLCVSFAGELEKISELPGYSELEVAANQNAVTLLPSVMSMTGAVNTGPGTVCIGYAADTHEFQ